MWWILAIVWVISVVLTVLFFKVSKEGYDIE